MKIFNWRNGLILSGISYVLYLILWLVLDYEIIMHMDNVTIYDQIIDFILCMLFTYTSLGFCSLIFNTLPFRTSYRWGIFYASCIFLLNNLIAFGMIYVYDLIFGQAENEIMEIKGAYTYAMIATFVSSVYANVFYLQSYIKVSEEKQTLEIALMKEKEIALQSQLNSLKLQINPHFMFNNFNNLLALIEEDTELASKFLNNLSKVYRYIIGNLNRDLIPIADEIKFLDSYIYLMKVRYDEGIIAKISPEVENYKGFIPPAVLQLLVENAIKHNGFSYKHPLFIDIILSDDYITVRNLKSPLLSKIDSIGLGQKNIIERYALLCDKKVKIENAENFYSVSLPIIKNIAPYEDTDS